VFCRSVAGAGEAYGDIYRDEHRRPRRCSNTVDLGPDPSKEGYVNHPTPHRSAYFEAVTAEDERLTATLAAIRADEETGHLTTREAADNRISALEAHLRKCQQLRRDYLEGGAR
jgi:hypothetical protein